ncbi:MAG TPA: amino acid adenylation domain-containing protein [Jatrophihabitans sp.]|uniref:non-ribosomal peptide synthetase n=1 Tax=Jatrophihabitans sp. TaxID=1932789 RepID=UPI002EDE410A
MTTSEQSTDRSENELAADETRLALSFAQEQLWFLEQMAPGQTTYNILLAWRLEGALDVDVLQRSLAVVVARHGALRSLIRSADGTPYQVVQPPADVELAVLDLTALTAQAQQGALEEALEKQAATAFDMENGPLCRFTLFKLGPQQHAFAVEFHHIVMDGWSTSTFNADLAKAYQALVSGRSPEFPELELDYAEYAARQRQRLQGEELEAELRYWQEKLSALPTLDLPADRRRPASANHSGANLMWQFSPELLAAARALAQQHHVSLYVVLVAAFKLVVSRYTGHYDIPVGVPMLGRTEPELEAVVGLFINMTVLRSDLSGDPTFAELLERVADASLDLYEHQEVPFHQVVDRVAPTRDPSRNPLFQVAVQLLGTGVSGGALPLPGIESELLEQKSANARFDLSMSFMEGEDQLGLIAEYSTDLFDKWRIQAMMGHLQTVLETVTKTPSLRLSQVALLSEKEQRSLVELGKGEVVPYEQEPLHIGFAKRVAANPDAIAVVCKGVEVSYAELNRRAEHLARHLRSLGLQHGQVVAVVIDRDVDAYVIMLGVLKAGGAFAMLDPQHPPARLQFMIEDTSAPIVITRSDLDGRLPEPAGWSTVWIDKDWPSIEAHALAEPLEEWATRDSVAYVLYTSGSTGTPKGVVMAHRGVSFYAEAYRRTFDVGPHDRLLQLPALSFDMSQGEIWTAFLVGARVVAVSPEEGQSAEGLAQLMRDQRVTYAGLSPAMLSLVEAGPYPDLKYVMGGAEAVPAELVNKWNLPGRRFVNLYGPTEASIACTEYECEHIEWQTSPPIGHAQVNRQLYIVDEFMHLVPPGIPGELLVGGEDGALALGYLNRPDLTAEKFVPDPYYPERLVYRTGDLVRWNRQGEIDFLGRIDTQVKLRGLRIELGEIEAALLTHPAVRMAVVVMRPNRQGDNQLVGYLTSKGDQAPDLREVRDHLATRLPEYMVPTAWVVLDAFPLTAARKIDRKALPEPEDQAPELNSAVVEARTPTERAVVDIFADVLGVDAGSLGVNTGLFDIGGSSLQAMRVVSRINKGFKVKINIRKLYANATVEAISATIDELVAAKTGPASV